MSDKIIERVLYGVDVVVVNDKNQLLMLQRNVAGENFKTGWEYVKGGVKVGETREEAARRELSEETGLQGGELTLLEGERMIDARYRNKTSYDRVSKKALVYRTTAEVIQLDAHEHEAYQRMSRDDALLHCWVEKAPEIIMLARKSLSAVTE